MPTAPPVTAEDLRNPMDGSETEHINHPLRPDCSEDEQGADDPLLKQNPSCPGDGRGEKSQVSQDGAAAKGKEPPQVQHPAGQRQEEAASLLKKRESGPGDGTGEESQDPHDGAATKGTELPQVQDPAGHKGRDSNSESETRPRKEEANVSEDALGPQNGSATKGTELPQGQDPTGRSKGEPPRSKQRKPCTKDGTREDPPEPPARKKEKKNFRECLGNCFRSHPVLTVVLALLLYLVVVFGVPVFVVSAGRGRTETRVTPGTQVTPITKVTAVAPFSPVTTDTPRLPPYHKLWAEHHGFCYFFSKDFCSWDQARAQCSKLEASLAVIRDTDMDHLFRLSGNINYWIGLRRRDQRLQWVDGSSFTLSVPVQGNAECVFLADDELRSGNCSNEMSYLCSKPQTRP